MEPRIERLETSFRDPAGFVYKYKGEVYRFVSINYQAHYDAAQKSGLFQHLIASGLLIPFEELSDNHTQNTNWLHTLKPTFITPEIYPFEWSFHQLKDAALVTLHICKEALKKGCILKDATPHNIRFNKGKPVLIDHLSFEVYEAGASWHAYRQFCETMLYPLLLNYYCGIEVHRTLQAWPSGIPAKVVINLLPFRCRFNLNIYLHTYIMASVSESAINAVSKNKKHQLSQKKILQILNNLEQLVLKLTYYQEKSIWTDYYESSILSKKYLDAKIDAVQYYSNKFSNAFILDTGCNDGTFSFNFPKSNTILAADADAGCISKLYEECKKKKRINIYPAVIDLMHPTPATGWYHNETTAFWHRNKFDLIIALALVHHLCIGQNLKFEQLAKVFSTHCKFLLIEFVPKTDPKTKQLLIAREDIFPDYTEHDFEAAFENYFTWEPPVKLPDSDRKLFFMTRKYDENAEVINQK